MSCGPAAFFFQAEDGIRDSVASRGLGYLYKRQALNYVALFSRSGQGHNVWVKRVIGKGGDKLEFHDNAVYRNGTKLNEPYINGVMEFSMPGSFTVPEGTIFVMGDNRNHSSDSRFIGPIPIDHVLGTVVVEL